MSMPSAEFAPDIVVAATYNIHSCVGRDRHCDPWRVLRVLSELGADFYGLQEVASRSWRQGYHDQFEFFAAETGMHAIAGSNLSEGKFRFGNALLSRWPITAHQLLDLSVPRRERRGAIIALVSCRGRPVRVVNTHFGLGIRERRRQLRRLHGAIPDDGIPTIFLGDFNMWGSEGRRLGRLGAPFARTVRPRTFPAWYPVLALDRVWTSGATLVEARAHVTPASASASDHLPLRGVVRLPDDVEG